MVSVIMDGITVDKDVTAAVVGAGVAMEPTAFGMDLERCAHSSKRNTGLNVA